MILTNHVLKTFVTDSTCYGPCSVDLRLGFSFAKYDLNKNEEHPLRFVDFDNLDNLKYIEWITEKPVMIMPGEFMLATTIEKVNCPDDVAAYVEGRSSIGRLGLQVQNAGFIDPGFKGEITLELANQSRVPIKVIPGMRICQVVFMMLTESSMNPYDGKYMNQSGATTSRFEGLE